MLGGNLNFYAVSENNMKMPVYDYKNLFEDRYESQYHYSFSENEKHKIINFYIFHEKKTKYFNSWMNFHQ